MRERSRELDAGKAKGGRRDGPGRPSGTFTQHRRLDRLRDALEAHPNGLPLAALARALQVTTRSVRRYLNELERQVQLESFESTPGGAHLWRIKPVERGRALTLRRTQAYGLLATRRLFETMRGSALFDELDVVHRQLLQIAQRPTRAAGDVPAQNRIDERLVFAPTGSRPLGARADELDEIFHGLAHLRAVVFRYRGNAGAPSPERVTAHPYALVHHDGAFHCVAYVPASGDVQVFSLERVTGARVLETEPFSLPPDFDVNAYMHGTFGIAAPRAAYRVLVEFDPRAADDVTSRRFHPTQKVATAPDGRARLSFVAADLAPVARWVLGFGALARALEPPELVERVRSELRRALDKYPR